MTPSAVTHGAPAAATESTASGWDLNIELIEQVDPAKIVMMTDDNCGTTCQKTTCISAV